MTPRTDLEWIDLHGTEQEVTAALRNARHERLLVGDEGVDDIVGAIPVRRALVALLERDFGKIWSPRPLPNALACKPVGDPVARPIDQDTKVDAVLADTARYSPWLIMALAAMLPAGLLIGLLLPLLIVLFPVAAGSLLIAAGPSAILSALLAAGFGWFITDVVGRSW